MLCSMTGSLCASKKILFVQLLPAWQTCPTRPQPTKKQEKLTEHKTRINPASKAIVLFIEAQFDRCLDQHYGIILSPIEDSVLMRKYGQDPQHPGMVKYRDLCKAIDSGMCNNVDCTFFNFRTDNRECYECGHIRRVHFARKESRAFSIYLSNLLSLSYAAGKL